MNHKVLNKVLIVDFLIVVVLLIMLLGIYMLFTDDHTATDGYIPSTPPTQTGGDSSLGTPTEPPVIYVKMNISGFCEKSCCCGKFADGITASGHKIVAGDCFVAAPSKYPFGTKMTIPGYNNGLPVEVRDRGGAIDDNKLDLYFGDKDGVSGHQRALEFGRQYLIVKIERSK